MHAQRQDSPVYTTCVRRPLMAASAAAGLLLAQPLFAYVGPGAGLTMLGALWALLAAVFIAVGFIVLWPLRRWRRRRAGLTASAKTGAEARRGNAPGMTPDDDLNTDSDGTPAGQR